MRYHTPSQSGFSLVETLVAITILLIVIVGPLTIITSTSRSTSFASEQVTAFFLAQEGNEIAQKGRDDLILDGPITSGANSDPWGDFTDTSGVYEPCYRAAGCGLELNTNSAGSVKTPVVDCNVGTCELYYDSSAAPNRQRYTYVTTGNTKTTFERRTYFELLPGPGADEVRVVTTVTWRTGSLRSGQSVSVETVLFDVYGN